MRRLMPRPPARFFEEHLLHRGGVERIAAEHLTRDRERRAFGHHAAVMNEDHAIADVLHLGHVVRRVEDREAALATHLEEKADGSCRRCRGRGSRWARRARADRDRAAGRARVRHGSAARATARRRAAAPAARARSARSCARPRPGPPRTGPHRCAGSRRPSGASPSALPATRSPPDGAPPSRSRAARGRRARRGPRSAGSTRAGCAGSWSCPPRWRRAGRRPLPRAPRRRRRRAPSCVRSACGGRARRPRAARERA